MTVTPEGVCPKIVESLEGAPRWTVVRHIKLPFDSCFVVLFKYCTVEHMHLSFVPERGN